jgi:hypothetical protein
MDILIGTARPPATAPRPIPQGPQKRRYEDVFSSPDTSTPSSPLSSPQPARAQLVIPPPPSREQQAAKRRALSTNLFMASGL